MTNTMMPWEHAVVGYLGYSLFVHAAYRESPTARETIVVVFAAVLPDLIDKPLAWELGVFASGHALAHSVFFAIPLSLTVVWLASRSGRPRVGWAFAIGYLLHLPADLIPKYLLEGDVRFDRILWPVRREKTEYEAGFRGEFVENVAEYAVWVSEQAAGEPDPYLFIILGIGGSGVLLWIYDGMPVARESYQTVRRVARALPPSGERL